MADNELLSDDDSESGPAAEDSQVGCFRCGLCCTLYRVFLTMEDAQQIAQYTGLALDDFIEDYLESHLYELSDDLYPDQEQIVLRRVEARCIFLEQTADKKQISASSMP